MDDLPGLLQAETFVNIYVGETTPHTKPFLLQRQLLERNSTKLKETISQLEERDSLLNPVLRLPNDDEDSWNAILSWLINHRLPPELTIQPVKIEKLIHNWIVGHKYGFCDFQDVIMIELLRFFNDRNNRITTAQIKLDFPEENPEWTELKEPVVEEAAKNLFFFEVDFSIFRIEECEGIPKLMPAMFKAHRRFLQDKVGFLDRYAGNESSATGRWDDFMTEGGMREVFFDEEWTRKPRKRKWSAVEHEAAQERPTESP